MNENKLPLVSIIITSYNRAHCIALAIESALAQDYPNLEIVISDNCSTDNSMEVINRYSHDHRMKISSNSSNIGMTLNFEKATMELSSGEYITYVSSDDCLCDDRFISDAISLAGKYPDVLLIFGRLRQIISKHDVVAETHEKPFWLKEFWKGKDVFLGYSTNSWLSFGGCIHHRKELIALKPFESPNMGKDIEINLRLLLQGNACFINRVCYQQLIHFKNGSLTLSADERIHIVRNCFEEVYQYALTVSPKDKPLFDKWRNDVLTTYFKQILISLKITSTREFKVFLEFVKENYGDIYSKINRDPRWKLMNALYHPILFPVLRVLSPKRYDYFRKRSNMIS